MIEYILTMLMILRASCFTAFNGPVNLEALREKLLELNQQMLDIINTAEGEERELTEEEMDKLDGLKTDFKNTERQVKSIENVIKQTDKLREPTQRQTEPNAVAPQQGQDPPPPASGMQVVGPAAHRHGNHGFRALGEFALAVRNSKNGLDPRLVRNAPTTYGSEGTGADGGFMVPPDFRTEIMEKVMGEDSLLGRADVLETSSNTFSFPKDETTPWQSSGGILAYWESEGGQLTQSKPALEGETLRLNKLTALVPVTEELLEDAPALDSYLRRKVPVKFDWKITDALINGTGAGQPTGILNCGSIVSQAKESGQSADTVVFNNIINIWSRMYGPCRARAVWHINQDIEPQLFTMSFEGSSSSVPAYMPANGLSGSPYATLMGRPVVPTQACQTLGDKGDIILADWSQYMAIIKTGGIRTDVSIHLYFDYDMVAYRFVMRIAGQPWWRAAITPANSTATLGAFVTLDERG